MPGPTPFGQFRLPNYERQNIRGRLYAPVRLEVVLDEKDAEYVRQEVMRAMQMTAEKALVSLGAIASMMLSQMYASVGRRNLSALWTNTPVKKLPDGSLEVVVYNEMMFRTYHTPSKAPYPNGGRRKTYPIKGALLMKILEEGARPHIIASRNPSRMLSFPIEGAVSESRFVGSAITRGGSVSVGRFAPIDREFTDVVNARSVAHPGVVGSRFVDIVAMRLDRMIDAEVQKNVPNQVI